MGVVLMSKRELNRIDVLARLDAGRLTTLAAADLMRVTVRQAASEVETLDIRPNLKAWIAHHTFPRRRITAGDQATVMQFS